MRGFSLVEVMVTILIFSLIFAAVFMLLTGGEASWYTGDVQIELNQEIRKALLTVNKELRQTASSVISDVPADGDYYTSITFRIPEDIDGDGDVISAIGTIEWSDNINYSLNANNQIIRSVSGTPQAVLANNISELTFTRPNPRVVQIYIKARKSTLTGRNLEAEITSSLKLRN